jgi:hypothetical protein
MQTCFIASGTAQALANGSIVNADEGTQAGRSDTFAIRGRGNPADGDNVSLVAMAPGGSGMTCAHGTAERWGLAAESSVE